GSSIVLRFELRRRQVAETRVGPDLVVMTPPLLDTDFGIDAVPEPLQAQKLVAKLAIERFAGRILPRLAGIDQRRVNRCVDEPAQNRRGHELGPIVRAQKPWR